MRCRITESEYLKVMEQCRESAELYEMRREALLSELENTSAYWYGEAADFLRTGYKKSLEEGEYECVRRSYSDVADGMEQLLFRIRDQMEQQNEMSVILSGERRAEPAELYLDTLLQDEVCNDIRNIMNSTGIAVDDVKGVIAGISDIIDLIDELYKIQETMDAIEDIGSRFITIAEDNILETEAITRDLGEIFSENTDDISDTGENSVSEDSLSDGDEANIEYPELSDFIPKLYFFLDEYDLSLEDVMDMGLDFQEIFIIIGTDLSDPVFNGELLEELKNWLDGKGFNIDFSNTDKYIPNGISDITVLFVISMLSVMELDNDTVKEHLDINTKAWDDMLNEIGDKSYLDSDGKYIDFQNRMESIIYGIPYDDEVLNEIIDYNKFNGIMNTCEIIAAFNAMTALGETPDFPEMIAYFEQNGIVFSGYFGTSPGAVRKYLEKEGCETEILIGDDITEENLEDMADGYDTYILTAYNNKDSVGGMIHTVSITVEDGEYVIHNTGGINVGTKSYSSLDEAVSNYNSGKGEAICIIGARKQETILWDARELLPGDSLPV